MKRLAILLLVLPMAANAALIDVEFSFDTPGWTGSASSDDTTGQAWDICPLLKAYELVTMEITLAGVASWDETEWFGEPPEFGVIVDSVGRAALIGSTFDTDTFLGWGTGIGTSGGLTVLS
jgi:hypothetical protein